MTLDETDKPNNNEQEQNNETVNKHGNNNSSSVNQEVNSNQEESMQWTTTTMVNNNNNDELNKAANKRTFDQISEGQQPQTTSSCSESSTNEAQVVGENGRDDLSSIVPSKDEFNDSTETSNNNKSILGDSSDQIPSVETGEQEEEEEEEMDSSETIKDPVKFKVVYAKEIFEIIRDLNETISSLKNYLQKLTAVTNTSQKLCYKGNLNDNKTLKECGIKDGVKVMMIGSKANDILAMASCNKETVARETIETTHSKEPLCQQKLHKKIIEKGIPEQAMSAWIGEDCPLPLEPLTGMLNKYGNRVRMTFKLETDQLWISTKERTQKIAMTAIKSVTSEPIENYQHYHIMALQVGPTEASRLWFYWVPSQYVLAIKNVILRN